MRHLAGLLVLLVLLSNGVLANAQQIEIHPYVGGFFPQKFLDLLKVKNEGIYGVKAGVFLTNNIEAEGHFGYISNVNFVETLTRKRAYIWEGSGSYHVGRSPRFYGTAGVGGVTTTTGKDSDFFFDPSAPAKERFLSISYGGGMKVLQVWGPLGFRVDVRGRTLPRYYGFRFSWLEATGGLTFSFNAGRSKRSQSSRVE